MNHYLVELGTQSRPGLGAVRTNLGNMSPPGVGREGKRRGLWGLAPDCNIWTFYAAAERAHWQLFSTETGRDIDGVKWRRTHTHTRTQSENPPPSSGGLIRTAVTDYLQYINTHTCACEHRRTDQFGAWKLSLRSEMLAPGRQSVGVSRDPR